MLAKVKKLSNSAGNLRELIQLLECLWRDDAGAFEALLSESTKAWSDHERIPLALRVLITERNDPRLREIIRKVCDSSNLSAEKKQFLYFVAALWGDEWAKTFHQELLTREMDKAVHSNSGRFSAVLWEMLCNAMLEQYSNRIDLERLKSRLEQKGARKSEYAGMVEALLELEEKGFAGLVERLETATERMRISDTDLKACFVLGATGRSEHAPLFLNLYKNISGKDWWSRNLRGRALLSLAYCTRLGAATTTAVEECLVRYQKKMSSWWFGGSWTTNLMHICAVLWNISDPPGQKVIDVLNSTAKGADKENAKWSIALLTLKNIRPPDEAKWTNDDYHVLFAKDYLQYDSILNFSYYWRCRECVAQLGSSD
jgi:hypothetical protein